MIKKKSENGAQPPISIESASSDTDLDETRPDRPEPASPPAAWSATRREVLKSGAAAAAMATLLSSDVVRAMGAGSGKANAKKTEKREFLFDFSSLDTRDCDLILVAGKRRYELQETPPGVLEGLRKRHPVLESVPDSQATHWLRARFPTEGVLTCYVQRINRRGPGGGRGSRAGRPWDMVMQFDQVSTGALREADARVLGQLAEGELPPVSGKWTRFGLTADELADLADPVGLDSLKTCDDTAVSIVSKHPEIVSGDGTTCAYIQQKIIGPLPQTTTLAQTIELLGPITPQQSWTDCDSPIVMNSLGYGTNVPVCNPDTGEQAINSKGDLQYVPVYASATNQAASATMTPSLQQVKADATLGANTTQDPAQSDGTLYRYSDGTTTSDQTGGSLGAGNGLSYTTKDYSPGGGYQVDVIGVRESQALGISAVITLKVQNWYVRYLSLFVRYLDGDGNVIPVDSLDDVLLGPLQQLYPLQQEVGHFWNTPDDYFLDLLEPEKEILGIPTSEDEKTLEIPVPDQAVSFLLLAGGMGNTKASSNPFNGSTIPGATMTGLFNLSLPTFFLALNAAAGVGGMLNKLSSDTQTLLSIVPLVLDLFAESFEAIGFSDPAAFEGLAKDIAETLISNGAKTVVEFVVMFLTEGETEEDLLDAIPIVGGFLAAVFAIGTVTMIAESSTQVMQSPSTYDFEVTLTHDLDVVIGGDPNNAGSWPSTAVSYKVTLLFAGGTPTSQVLSVPMMTVQSQTASFQAVPLGGLVTASVQVYSDTGFQVATASAGPFDNLDPRDGSTLTLPLTLSQQQVPLTSRTVYSHKEVIELDAQGDHIWNSTTTAPVQEPSGCTPASGQLCELTGITVNTTAGAVGQSFESANAAVTNCVTGSGGQTNQFSNLSVTADPQSEYFFSGCGFSGAPRLVYDLVNDVNYNFYLDTSTTGLDFKGVIRQIRLEPGSFGFDAPDSNRAWGKLQFSSDALLLHPAGKIVSVNSSHSKLEVVQLPSGVVADADAPTSQTYGGRGLREGLMDGPALAALAPDGTVLVLEQVNDRIQAFDLNANPAQKFGVARTDYFFPLKQQAVSRYLDFAVEFEGYMYVLWEDVSRAFTLDLYDPQGNFLSTTPDFAARTMTVNYWRDLYAQNFQVLRLPDGSLPARTEPSVSHWIPSTP